MPPRDMATKDKLVEYSHQAIKKEAARVRRKTEAKSGEKVAPVAVLKEAASKYNKPKRIDTTKTTQKRLIDDLEQRGVSIPAQLRTTPGPKKQKAKEKAAPKAKAKAKT
jgi:hypothetical protein